MITRGTVGRTAFAAAALMLLPGCGGSDELESPTAKKLRALGNFYLESAITTKGEGPKDEAAFRKHVRGTSDQILGTMGLKRSDLDGLFTSERDGEPFVIRYGVRVGRVSGTEAPLVAHEKTGKDGKRLAGFANGKVELVTEDRLNGLMSATQ